MTDSSLEAGAHGRYHAADRHEYGREHVNVSQREAGFFVSIAASRSRTDRER